jgi:hypothetical protein
LKLKKIRVRFPNLISGQMVVGDCTKQVMKLPQIQDINNRIYSKMFAGESGMTSGARMLPKIEGFNCTWISDKSIYGQYVDAQFTFASSEDKKVMRIIEKYGGKIVDTRDDLVQNGQSETNLTNTGIETEFENIAETLRARDFD